MTFVKEKIFGSLAALAIAAGSAAVYAQKTPAPTPKPSKPSGVVVRVPRPAVRVPRAPIVNGVDSEYRVMADPNVNVKFCVTEGDVRINGWERDEIRVYVRSGRKLNVRVLEKNQATSKPSWVWLTGQVAGSAGISPECLSGSSIEIDVPMGATINAQGRSSDMLIDSVRKAKVEVVEGDLALRNISGGVAAAALQGDLVIENVSGPIALDSTTGNIFAVDLTPGQIGDAFKAKTNSGAISLQNVGHRQLEANTISGAVVFDGGFLPGGIYTFKTSNGTIQMALPGDTNCTLTAAYGFGSFSPAIPIEIVEEIVTPGGKSVIAKIGKGEVCNVSLTTTTGKVILKKK